MSLGPALTQFHRVAETWGGGSSIVKVPGDVPPARVYFFELSSLAKGILLGNFCRFWSGQGYAFGNFGQINVKLR